MRGLWGFVRGGMGAISEAIAGSAQAKGARIRTNAGVARVLVRGGRAYGVALADGEEIHARAVISNADPKVTFLKLIEPGEIDEEFRREIERFRVEGCSMKINLALDALPDFKALPGLRSALSTEHDSRLPFDGLRGSSVGDAKAAVVRAAMLEITIRPLMTIR